jgi:HK97 family phage prohead protease
MIVEGYAALFGEPDLGGDTVRKGAFAGSLARRVEPLPMLLEHEPRAQAGVWREAFEDQRGLFVRGVINDAMPGAGRTRRALARGVDGLSIGFVPLVSHRRGEGRMIEEIELLEVSIVAFPMQPQARLTLAREFDRAVA